MCELCVHVVSGHLLGGEFQPPASVLYPEANSFLLQSLLFEDEFGCFGLGMSLSIVSHVAHIHCICNYITE